MKLNYSHFLRPNFQSLFARNCVWLHLAPPTATQRIGFLNLVHPSMGFQGPGGTSWGIQRTAQGDVYISNNAGASNTATAFLTVSIPNTMPRTMVAVVASERLGGGIGSGTAAGLTGAGVWYPGVARSAADVWQAYFYHSGGANAIINGPAVVLNQRMAIAVTWRPGIGIFAAFNGELYEALFTGTQYGSSAPQIGPFHNYRAGSAMAALMLRSYTNNELIRASLDPYGAFFWQPRRGIVVPSSAPSSFLPYWARPASGMIGAGVR